MNLSTLALRSTRRNITRTFLTIVGVMIGVLAFGFLQTVIAAWYLGVETASSDRLVTRNKVSLGLPITMAHKPKIQQVPGVSRVAAGNWFGAVYIDEQNFFPQFGCEISDLLALYPEFVVSAEEKKAVLEDKTGALVGE